MDEGTREMGRNELISFVESSSGNAHVLAAYAGVSNKDAFEMLWELLVAGELKATAQIKCEACNRHVEVVTVEDTSKECVLYQGECPFCSVDILVRVEDFTLDWFGSTYETRFFVEHPKKRDEPTSIAHVRQVSDILADTSDSIVKHVLIGGYHSYNDCCVDFFIRCRIVGVDPLRHGGKASATKEDYILCPQCSKEVEVSEEEDERR